MEICSLFWRQEGIILPFYVVFLYSTCSISDYSSVAPNGLMCLHITQFIVYVFGSSDVTSENETLHQSLKDLGPLYPLQIYFGLYAHILM